MEFDPLWDEPSRLNLERVAQDIVHMFTDQPTYWDKIRDLYASLPDTLSPAERWTQAYRKMEEELGTYKEPGNPPSFDPPAQTPQEFAAQYAEAITHMMATHASHLELPKHFMDNWLKAEKKEKEG